MTIECLSEFVRSKIKDEIPDQNAIIGDDVTNKFSNKEILPVCLRYVIFCANQKPYICETFFDSLHIQGRQQLLLQRNETKLSKYRAQTYGGAGICNEQ